MKNKIKKTKPLKVGFDLDGVLLYNPARIIRPIVSMFKDKGLIKRKQLQFYCPKTKREQWMWKMFHKSSISQASGLDELKKLVDDGLVEAYVITARFDYLEDDFDKWMKKIDADSIFKKCYLNKKNEQPHQFKERMVKKLKLEVFVEDNWDIVSHLNKSLDKKNKPEIMWIYNMFDKKIDYGDKYPNLSSAIKRIDAVVKQGDK